MARYSGNKKYILRLMPADWPDKWSHPIREEEFDHMKDAKAAGKEWLEKYDDSRACVEIGNQ